MSKKQSPQAELADAMRKMDKALRKAGEAKPSAGKEGILRPDIIIGLQQFLRVKAKGRELLKKSGYCDTVKEAKRILRETPGLIDFLVALRDERDADAFDYAAMPCGSEW